MFRQKSPTLVPLVQQELGFFDDSTTFYVAEKPENWQISGSFS
jgi:hypothetical protein